MEPPQNLPPRPPRLEYELPVAYRTVSGFITDWAVNISRGGLFINTQKPLSVGTPVRLIVSLPGTEFPFDLTGRVTRINTAHEGANHVPGMAIEFVNVDDEKRALIEQFVERLRAEMPSDEAG
ncbi:TIGR02266 family protein [Stigmatella sp. ncwal1]|uniref:TIGR02266 family protein n=1 Tax=Stigmatella ashevillensis TaxID=2995309 RepID=A0ABT5D1S4_9BACT|nr:TIGR02266 family protein [Stigmatella ashevillena]MDC0707614.1 TIGR02266 family protein [Stigmatella ashevillena]